jgi:serine/threonine-protein kinase PknK
MAGVASRSGEEVGRDPFAAIGCDEVAPIGSGGSSIVYRARQRAFDRLVALKVLTQPLTDERSRRRFERELTLAGRLTGHPNVVTVFASGFFADGRPYVQMEYCPGGSLADRLAAQGPFPVRDVVSIGVKLAGVLELARREGIVHRDVKPANVLVTRFGEPALADFGIAIVSGEMTGTTQALTPVHAAPEVLESRDIGPAADQWSLGSTLHTVLAGRAPFASDGDESLLTGMLRILNDAVPAIPRADVPERLRAVVERALAKPAADRWPTPADLGRALQEVEREQGWPVTALPIEEVPEARYGPGPVDAAARAAGAGAGPGTTHGVPAPAGAPAVDGAATVPWRRATSTGAGTGPSPAGAPGVPPLDPRPPSPPPGALVGTPAPPVGPPAGGEATQHWSRPRPAPPPPPAALGPAGSPAGRRWWVVGAGLLAAVAVVIVAVVVLGASGSPSRAGSGAVTTRTVPTQDPSQLLPQGVHITNEAGTAVSLQWQDAVSGLEHVIQARNQLTGQQTDQFTSATSYTYSGLTPGVAYCFAVGTVEATGAVFAPTVTCTAGAHAGPAPPGPG